MNIFCRLVLEDPFDSHNNVGRGCFAIRTIQTAFAQALSNLLGRARRRPSSLRLTAFAITPDSPPAVTISTAAAAAAAAAASGISIVGGMPSTPPLEGAGERSVLGRLFGADHHNLVLALANRLWAPPIPAPDNVHIITLYIRNYAKGKRLQLCTHYYTRLGRRESYIDSPHRGGSLTFLVYREYTEH